jgi:hypothetical protein
MSESKLPTRKVVQSVEEKTPGGCQPDVSRPNNHVSLLGSKVGSLQKKKAGQVALRLRGGPTRSCPRLISRPLPRICLVSDADSHPSLQALYLSRIRSFTPCEGILKRGLPLCLSPGDRPCSAALTPPSPDSRRQGGYKPLCLSFRCDVICM